MKHYLSPRILIITGVSLLVGSTAVALNLPQHSIASQTSVNCPTNNLNCVVQPLPDPTPVVDTTTMTPAPKVSPEPDQTTPTPALPPATPQATPTQPDTTPAVAATPTPPEPDKPTVTHRPDGSTFTSSNVTEMTNRP